MSDERPMAAHDIPADAYPFTIKACKVGTNEVVWEETVEGPGVLEIPGLRRKYGDVYIVATYANGDTVKMGNIVVAE